MKFTARAAACLAMTWKIGSRRNENWPREIPRRDTRSRMQRAWNRCHSTEKGFVRNVSEPTINRVALAGSVRGNAALERVPAVVAGGAERFHAGTDCFAGLLRLIRAGDRERIS